MSTEIPLTQGLAALVDDEDYARVVAATSWHAYRCGKTFYAKRKVRLVADGPRVNQHLHTFLTGWPLVDHINRNGLDNRRVNLREATKQQNGANRGLQSNNTSGFKGVTWNKECRSWQAKIAVSGVTRYLGLFSTPEKAARAYDTAAKDSYGEFAWLNFPNLDEQGRGDAR
jgi:hypothetical protein